MRRLVPFVFLLLALPLPARAQWKTGRGRDDQGRYGLVIIPENRNGGLFKVVERKQRGAPIGSLVCSGEPNDRPPGATCGARHRCKRGG